MLEGTYQAGGVTVIVVAAGRGKRMNSDVAKQFILLEGRPILCYCLEVFEKSGLVDDVVLVTGADAVDFCRKDIVEKYGFSKVRDVVVGGKERYHSVWNGLKAIHEGEKITDHGVNPSARNPKYVLIHDGARPFVTEEIIKRNVETLKAENACITGMPAKDTIKIADETGYVATTPKRSLVWMIQTPQSFDFSLVYRAYEELISKEEEVLEKGIVVTDDAMVVEHFTGTKVRLVEGSYENIKITTPGDLIIAKNLSEKQ